MSQKFAKHMAMVIALVLAIVMVASLVVPYLGL